jgi:hypothetical protein
MEDEATFTKNRTESVLVNEVSQKARESSGDPAVQVA